MQRPLQFIKKTIPILTLNGFLLSGCENNTNQIDNSSNENPARIVNNTTVKDTNLSLSTKNNYSDEHPDGTMSQHEKKLMQARDIVIKESFFSIGKHYDIYVENEKVASVEGKGFRILGDTFTIRTVDKKVLAYEKEEIKFLQVNRAASVYDSSGKTLGYFGEETMSDLFYRGHRLHFYNLKREKSGTSLRINPLLKTTTQTIVNANGSTDYEIIKKFNWIGVDQYHLKVCNTNSQIPLSFALFATCIEDAINDAASSKDD